MVEGAAPSDRRCEPAVSDRASRRVPSQSPVPADTLIESSAELHFRPEPITGLVSRAVGPKRGLRVVACLLQPGPVRSRLNRDPQGRLGPQFGRGHLETGREVR